MSTGPRSNESTATGAAAPWLAALVLTASGCAYAPSRVLDLPGPEFLLFFFLAFLGSVAVAWTVQAVLSGRGPAQRDEPADLATDELASLAGGRCRLLASALAGLVSANAVKIAPGPEFRLLRTEIKTPTGTEAEETLWRQLPVAGAGATLEELAGVLGRLAARHEEKLAGDGLLCRDAAMAARVGALIALVVPVIGFMKVAVGLSRGRSVGLLLVLEGCALTVITVFYLNWRRRRISRRGQRTLWLLQARHDSARDFRKKRREADESAARTVALAGVDAWAAPAWTEIAARLKALPDDDAT